MHYTSLPSVQICYICTIHAGSVQQHVHHSNKVINQTKNSEKHFGNEIDRGEEVADKHKGQHQQVELAADRQAPPQPKEILLQA